MDISRARARSTYVIIADISGNIHAIQRNRCSLGHGQYVVRALLDAVIDAAMPILMACPIDDDAVVFYAVSAEDHPRGGVTGSQIGLAILDVLKAFYATRADLGHGAVCRCGACQHIDNLDLNVVVHRGGLVDRRVNERDEMSGMPVLVAKGLLNNALGIYGSVIVTEEAARTIDLPLRMVRDRYVHRDDEMGDIMVRVYEFEAPYDAADTNPDAEELVSRRMRDAVVEFSENARNLGRPLPGSP